MVGGWGAGAGETFLPLPGGEGGEVEEEIEPSSFVRAESGGQKRKRGMGGVGRELM